MRLLRLSIFLALLFFGCKKQDVKAPEPQNPFTISEAKSWYEKQNGRSAAAKGTTGGNARTKERTTNPIWEKAMISSDENYFVVEVPIIQDIKFNSKFASSSPRDGITKLLILESKKDGVRSSLFMHVYAVENGGSYSYARPSADFTGLVFYTSLKDEFLLGWMFDKGKVTKKSTKSVLLNCNNCLVLPDEGNSQCTTYATSWYERDCWTVIYNNEYQCGEWQYLYTTYQTYCTYNGSGGGTYSYQQQTDCAGVLGGSAYIGSCGICVGGTTGLSSCYDPCAERIVLSNQALNNSIAYQNSEILSKTSSTGHEYGTERNLTSLHPTNWNNFVNTSIRTNNQSSSFTPQFSWNSNSGYTVGVAHGHPANGAPSPADAIWPVGNLSSPELLASGDIQFYRDNISVAAITNDATYIVVPFLWTSLEAKYSEFYNSFYTASDGKQYNSMNDLYRSIAEAYLVNNPATVGEATAYALMSIFGDAIHLFKAVAGSNIYIPLEIKNNLVSELPCNQ